MIDWEQIVKIDDKSNTLKENRFNRGSNPKINCRNHGIIKDVNL